MSAFRNIRIYPSHGTRSATITWELAPGIPDGNVYLAFSETGTDVSWQAVNPGAPVASALGTFTDEALNMNKGTADGFYRLLLITPDLAEYYSEPIQILGDLTPREYGVIRGIIHQEYTQMRVTNGFPVWHCIPRAHGVLADNIDPDTGKYEGEECAVAAPEDNGFGLKYKGGFYAPVLTWMRVLTHNEGLQDDSEEFSPEEMHKTAVRLMAFPRPSRGHMIVNPATDERFLVGDEIKPYRFRGVYAVAYNVTLEFLKQTDERYKFPVPFLDTKAYRRIPYWTPATLL